MIRIASLGILVITVWLANMAMPTADPSLRFERSIGIALQSDPLARSQNRPAARAGRLPAEVFGAPRTGRDAALPTEIAALDPAYMMIPAARKPAAKSFALVPLPALKPARDWALQSVEPTLQRVALSSAEPVRAPVPITGVAGEPEVAPAEIAAQPFSPAPETRMTRRERRRVARHVQRELRRVGCYTGAADGVWGPKTQSAMRNFATRISASLITNRPDYVALMLVESYDARACDRLPGADNKVLLVDAGEREPGSTGTARPIAVAAIAVVSSLEPVSVVAPSAPIPGRKPVSAARPEPAARNANPAPSDRARRTQRVARTQTRARRAAEPAEKTEPRKTTRIAASRPAPKKVTKRRRASPRVAASRARIRRARAANRIQRRRARRVATAQRRTLRIGRARRARRRVARRSYARTAGFRRGRRNWVRRAFSNDR